MHIDLLVDIRDPSGTASSQERVPALERCLARGDAATVAGDRFEQCLLQDYGMRLDEAPVAALCLAGEGDSPGPNYWLRADPVSLQPTLRRLAGRTLQPGELDWNEAVARAEVLAPHFRIDGCELIVKDPLRWYVRSPVQRLRTSPPPRVQVALDKALLPTGPDADRWQRFMTEAQMLLHAANLDEAREAAGRAPVNAIWIWGGGSVETLASRPYTEVISDEVLARGLARQSNSAASHLPDDPAELIAAWAQRPNGRVLVAISAGAGLSLADFDTRWLRPMVSAVEAGKTTHLTLRLLLGDRKFGRHITRTSLRRWWRRSRPFSSYA